MQSGKVALHWPAADVARAAAGAQSPVVARRALRRSRGIRRATRRGRAGVRGRRGQRPSAGRQRRLSVRRTTTISAWLCFNARRRQASLRGCVLEHGRVLVRAGTPGVVAMQYEITDLAAIELARSFYDSVASGLPIDTAMSEARKAVRLSLPGTRVGHARALSCAPDGVLFDVTGNCQFPPAVTPPAWLGPNWRRLTAAVTPHRGFRCRVRPWVPSGRLVALWRRLRSLPCFLPHKGSAAGGVAGLKDPQWHRWRLTARCW